jgi:hypothetical protein
METGKFNKIIYALLFTVLALALPIANPELATAIGGIFDSPLQLFTQIIGGIAGDVGQYEADIATFVFGSGVSSALVFGLTALLKKSKYLAIYPTQRIATILSLIVFSALFVSRKWGYEVEFDNVTQLFVMALTLFAGAGATQLGASAIHNKLVATDYELAYHREAGDGQDTSA